MKEILDRITEYNDGACGPKAKWEGSVLVIFNECGYNNTRLFKDDLLALAEIIKNK